MAETFKNFNFMATATKSDAYTATTGVATTIVGFQASNMTTNSTGVLNVWLYDASAGSEIMIYNSITCPAASAIGLKPDGDRWILEPGDIIRVQATAANVVRIFGSIVEVS